MNKNITSNTNQSGKRSCSVCKESVLLNSNEVRLDLGKNIVCEKCRRAKKKRKLALITFFLGGMSLMGIVGWLYLSEGKSRTAQGFGGVTSIKDSVSIQIQDVEKLAFNISSATISSAPISAQNPVNNIEDFNRIISKNTEDANKNGINKLSVPTLALQFHLNSPQLSETSLFVIAELAKFFKATSQDAIIFIEGFACNIGDKKINDDISQKRAEAVKSALANQGINANKIQTRWYGKSRNKEFQLSNQADYRRVLISFR
ncbi:OmpA family protein [Capnocytophaga canimorsus]|uniref:OmpA family protein n=1 Tax=Capnocytophaga canimorsus TaxID=28188 RepID=UPI0037D1D50B